MGQFDIGDRIWMIYTFDEIYWNDQNNIPKSFIARYPIQKRIIRIQKKTDGTTLYGVEDGHFTTSWIGTYVFETEREAMKAMQNKFKGEKQK